ncbi:MAG: hypothetical protein K9G49_09135 [Taibaiella sp.]|nr:hypothetical protein [Taibaiella sp.]
MKAQNISAKKNTLNKVFGDLVNAYGNAKSAPAHELIPKSSDEKYIATYISTPSPIIKVDEQLFDLCMQMGADSLNALSIILSHELAHYYNDHHWCTDFAFALSKEAKSKAEKEKNYWHSKEEKTIHEGEADNFGLYHSCIAGYSPFNVYSRLLHKIYTAYGLPENMIGYPSKNERKLICKEAENKIVKLYPVFQAGIIMLHLKYYTVAADCFQYLSMYFPSREVYNNLGVCKLFEALDYNGYDSLNFIYPIEVDPLSRMFQSINRGVDRNGKEIIQRQFFQEAKTAFEKALALDPQYVPAFINLACLYDAKKNYQSALGTISEIPVSVSYSNDIKLIEAIALYHTGEKNKSSAIFSELAKTNSPLLVYNSELALLAAKEKSAFEIEGWKDEWIQHHITPINRTCNFSYKLSLDSSHIISINEDLVLKSATYSFYEVLTIVNKEKKITIEIEKCTEESSPFTLANFFVLKENQCFKITSNNICWLVNYNIKYD